MSKILKFKGNLQELWDNSYFYGQSFAKYFENKIKEKKSIKF